MLRLCPSCAGPKTVPAKSFQVMTAPGPPCSCNTNTPLICPACRSDTSRSHHVLPRTPTPPDPSTCGVLASGADPSCCSVAVVPRSSAALLSSSMDRSMLMWRWGGGVWMSQASLGDAGASCLGYFGGVWGCGGRAVMAHGFTGEGGLAGGGGG